MPQLDPTWFVSQFFWLCICFGMLYFVVSKFLAPQMTKILETRQHKIDAYINKAQSFKDEAEKSLKEYESALKKAKDKVDNQIATQQKDLEKLIDDKNQEVTDKINQEVKKTQDFVLKAKKSALDKIDEIASDLSKEIIKKLDV
ncbi:MAG: hypothetical protein R3Y43_03705 [Alphaproteobacteria bacterium]